MTLRFLTLVIALLPALAAVSPVAAQQRGRPLIDSSLGYKVILTDEGTLLRGVSLGWDGGDPYGSLPKTVPTTDQLRRLAVQFGLNTVHLYLEGDSSQNPDPAGVNLKDADALVEATANAGLYLIITIGCNGENGSIHDMQFARDFWTVYAPRYRQQTHVIYEAHNEPALYTPSQWTIEDWNKQAELYQLMRQWAPETLILLGSFMGFAGDPTFGAEYLVSQGVSWDNAGFAHHGYESKAGIENAITIMQSSPDFPPLLATEFWPGDTEGQGYNSMYERFLNGWMQFQWLGADDEDLHLFRSKIDLAGTIWTPDSVTARWPALGSPEIPGDGNVIGLYQRGVGRFVRVAENSGDRLLADRDAYTGGLDADAFVVEQIAGRLFRLRALGGGRVRTTGDGEPLRADGVAVEDATIFEWIQAPDGDHVIRARDAGGRLLRCDAESGLVFADTDDGRESASRFALVTAAGDLPDPIVGTPFHGAPIRLPGGVEAEHYDLGGSGVSYLDSDATNNGNRFRVLEGVDIEVSEDAGGGFNVGWIAVGEWIEYTIEVPGDDAREFLLDVRVASPGSNARFGLRFDGVDSNGTIPVPGTGGYQDWSTLTRSVVLESGPQIMRFENRGSTPFNLNWFEFRPRPCPADFNGDGRVDGADLPIVLGSWGRCPGECPADVDGDGVVDAADLGLVIGAWGPCS